VANDGIIVGVDVGTTKVCVLVGEVLDNEVLRILGVGVAPSKGLRKGVVINSDLATGAIQTALQKAERTCGQKLSQAIVGIAGSHIAGINSRGVVAVSRSDHEITQSDVDRAVEAAQAIAVPANKEIIHIIPRSYTVDGQDGVRDPVGMMGIRLEVETHIVTGATTSIQNLIRCVEKAGLEVSDLVLEPLASGETALTDEEREMGVVLADIGGGTTDIGVFIEGSIWHTQIIPVGGNHLTGDVAVGLQTSAATAEAIKVRYGHALARAISPDEIIEVASFGNEAGQSWPRQRLVEILEARTAEIFQLIHEEIKRSGCSGLLPAGVVITGGTAELPGIAELGRQVLDLPVRVGAPRGLTGLADTLSSPAYSTSVGLLLWEMRRGAPPPPQRRSGKRSTVQLKTTELSQAIRKWLKAFIPQ